MFEDLDLSITDFTTTPGTLSTNEQKTQLSCKTTTYAARAL